MKIREKSFIILFSGIVLMTYLVLSFCLQAQSTNKLKEKPVAQKNAVNKSQKQAVSVNSGDEMVIVNVVNFGRQNPFKPYKKYSVVTGDLGIPGDIPLPPAFDEQSENQLKNLMESKVSGILYDPYGKSIAIINVKGTDYMVRERDSLFDFRIKKITKNNVTITCGNNTYVAGVGEIIGQDSINYDPVVRSNQSFGGMGYKLPSINPNGL